MPVCRLQGADDFHHIAGAAVPADPACGLRFETDADALEPGMEYGGGAIAPPSDGGGDFGGSGGDDESDPSDKDASLSSFLSKNNAKVTDFPPELLKAYHNDIIPIQALFNYLTARANPLSRIMLPFSPMRDRFLADRFFLLKILIEEGIGIFGKMTAEYRQRRAAFWKEGEFVLANVIMALLADFALVYFPAPSLSLKPPGDASLKGYQVLLNKLTSGLPSNIFQTNRPFTMAERMGGFTVKASQLFAVGFLCCFSGVVITNGLVYIRQRVDPTYKPRTEKQNPILMSIYYAAFLGLSSGTRYQLVNGVENHIFPRIFAKTPVIAEEVATFVLRYANTFWGSSQWVAFARLTNLQKQSATE